MSTTIEVNKTINEQVLEQFANIKGTKFMPASHYDDPSYLQIQRKDKAKYHVMYHPYSTFISPTPQSEKEINEDRKKHQDNEDAAVIKKIYRIENTIQEVLQSVKKLNSKCKIKFVGDSINTGYLGNRFAFSFEVNGEQKTKEYYFNENFERSTIISEISSYYKNEIEGVITYQNGDYVINGVSINEFMKHHKGELCMITIQKGE